MVWEDVSNLPFPPEVQEITKSVKWNEFEWNVMGLPSQMAKYEMTGGKELYLTELPDGEVKVEKMVEFTGRIIMGGYFVDEQGIGEFNYFVNFLITIVKGEVLEIKQYKLQKQPIKEYKEAIESMEANIRRAMDTSKTWWFKWIYRPWYLLVRGVGFILVSFLNFFKNAVVWTVRTLTPI